MADGRGKEDHGRQAETPARKTGMEEKARKVLESNLDQLNALATALLEHETLTRAEIDDVMKGTQTAN
jgi:ATP-dependent Zn protease